MATDNLKRYPPSVGQKPFGDIIKALAAIVTVHQTDKQFDADVLPRDPVILQVTRIKHALDELMKFVPLAAQQPVQEGDKGQFTQAMHDAYWKAAGARLSDADFPRVVFEAMLAARDAQGKETP